MYFSSLAAVSLVVILGHVSAISAQDAEGWYKAHPNMSRIKDVNQATHQIVDEFGRTRFFHGTNVVMKESPWYRPLEWVPGVSSFGEQDAQNMHDLGLNIVRLGHSWAGAEPVRGEYNETFLEIMKEQTKIAEEHGLYVLVDVHQDLLAKQLCGHGVPDVSVVHEAVYVYRYEGTLTFSLVVCRARMGCRVQDVPVSLERPIPGRLEWLSNSGIGVQHCRLVVQLHICGGRQCFRQTVQQLWRPRRCVCCILEEACLGIF